MAEQQLTKLLSRLEAVTSRLESVAEQKGTPSAGSGGQDDGK